MTNCLVSSTSLPKATRGAFTAKPDLASVNAAWIEGVAPHAQRHSAEGDVGSLTSIDARAANMDLEVIAVAFAADNIVAKGLAAAARSAADRIEEAGRQAESLCRRLRIVSPFEEAHRALARIHVVHDLVALGRPPERRDAIAPAEHAVDATLSTVGVRAPASAGLLPGHVDRRSSTSTRTSSCTTIPRGYGTSRIVRRCALRCRRTYLRQRKTRSDRSYRGSDQIPGRPVDGVLQSGVLVIDSQLSARKTWPSRRSSSSRHTRGSSFPTRMR